MKAFFKKNWKYMIAPGLFVISMAISFFISFPVVYGQSMESNLHEGDVLFLNKTCYRGTEDPERFDVVVAKGSNYYIIKRVIGLPGERIRVVNGQVYINGELLNDPYAREDTKDGGIANEEYLIPEGHFFIMGDNRNESADSRVIGAVPFENILGKCEKFLFNTHGGDKSWGDPLK